MATLAFETFQSLGLYPVIQRFPGITVPRPPLSLSWLSLWLTKLGVRNPNFGLFTTAD